MLKTYKTRLQDGRLFVVVAYQATDVRQMLDENGLANRNEVSSVRFAGLALEHEDTPTVYTTPE